MLSYWEKILVLSKNLRRPNARLEDETACIKLAIIYIVYVMLIFHCSKCTSRAF